MDFIVSHLDTIIQIAFILIGIGATFLLSKYVKTQVDEQTFIELQETLTDGIAHAQEEFVVWAKRSKADGKLDGAERKHAVKLAYEFAKKQAKGKAGKLLAKKGAEWAAATISKIVQDRKAK